MKTVRLGVIGVGNMGSFHARNLGEHKVKRCELTALCDVAPGTLEKYPASVKRFTDSRELIRSGAVDAVLIATPHYGHTTIGIDALRQGLHVLVEKPISVHKADCQRLIAAHKGKKQVFAAMFNQRTDSCYQKVRQLVQGGELGALRRVNWIITDWFRTHTYYAMGDWRATWAGEGGGVLLNQCPHNLDLLQWICGMPKTVRATCHLGKYHPIEVEDDVTAYFEYPDGATGVFVTTTGEAPGTNRLEINGDRGKVVLENGTIRFTRTEVSVEEFLKTSREGFARPDVWNVDIPHTGAGGQHVEIIQNFVDAILEGTPLVAPAREGIRSVELANAMLYSSLTNSTVTLPLNGGAYEKQLKKLIRGSKFSKKTVAAVEQDMGKSFGT